jgi:hypothetical protein
MLPFKESSPFWKGHSGVEVKAFTTGKRSRIYCNVASMENTTSFGNPPFMQVHWLVPLCHSKQERHRNPFAASRRITLTTDREIAAEQKDDEKG